MSTDPTGTTPPAATPAQPVMPPAPAGGVVPPAAGDPAAAPTATTEEFSSGHGPEAEEERESFFGRHSGLLVALMVAILVVAGAIAGLSYYRGQAADDNAATEAAFRASVQERGATVETVECDGDTCSAVIGGSAYTVLVQEDENGEQHFGVATYTGD
jgi:hypothetical protein